jgi:hypothetical protein
LKPVNVTTISQFAKDVGINQATYAIIDTEGLEPLIIKGMGLQDEKNRKMFPMFQWEVGSGWDQCSAKRWDQHKTALHLQLNGYELYFIGRKYWWRIHAAFFERGVGAVNVLRGCNADPANTDGPMFVWGNVLALHPSYALEGVLALVRASAIEHARVVRSSASSDVRNK